MRVEFRKGKFIDEAGNELSNTTDTPAGSLIAFTVVKNKTCPPDRRTGFYTLRWNGVDAVADLIEVALRCGLIEKSGAWYTIVGVEGKIQGQYSVQKFLEEHPEILLDLQTKVTEKISL